jgi:hypothetical protein
MQFMNFLCITLNVESQVCGECVQNQGAHAFPRGSKCKLLHINSNTNLQGINRNRENVLFQDNVIAHIANFSVIALEEILGEWLISH